MDWFTHPSGCLSSSCATVNVWYNVRKDVANWARTCQACQTSKVNRHVQAPLATFDTPPRRFSHLHIDVVGPLPESDGYKYLFTIVDRSTRWPEAIPMTDATTASCAKAFLNGWISRFGLPDRVTSDRGAQFTSELWQYFSQSLGIDLHHTCAYRPQHNGALERIHRTANQILIARLKGHAHNWHTPGTSWQCVQLQKNQLARRLLR